MRSSLTVLAWLILGACDSSQTRSPSTTRNPRVAQVGLQDSVRARLAAGGLLMWLDRAACESCLGLDLEARAILERFPHLKLLVITTATDRAAVGQFFAASRLEIPIIALDAAIWEAVSPAPDGGVQLELLGEDGRLLTSMRRTAGGQRPLFAEDLEQSARMVARDSAVHSDDHRASKRARATITGSL